MLKADLAQTLLKVVVGRDRHRVTIGIFRADALRQRCQGEVAAQMDEERHRIAAVRGPLARRRACALHERPG